MKHQFLRRLSALALAWILAASLCVTPAWADPGDGSGDGTGTVTPAEPQALELERVIILASTSSVKELTIKGVAKGETVVLAPSTNVTVNGNAGTQRIPVNDDIYNDATKSITVNVSATQTVSGGTIQVSRLDSNGDPMLQFPTLTCHVYCNAAPITAPDEIGPVAVGKTIDLNIGITDPAVAEFLENDDITFDYPASYLEITHERNGTSINAKIKAIQLLNSGSVSITMSLKGTVVKTWSLRIVANTDKLITYLHLPPVLTMTAGDTYTFKASEITILPTNAANKQLSWQVTSGDAVTVDAETGEITAEKPGSATVTATAKDGSGLSSSCVVTVKDSASALTMTPANVVLNLAANPPVQTAQLTATPTGENSATAVVTYRSSNTRVATVDANGLVTAVNAGTATITATAVFTNARGGKVTKTATSKITVLDGNSIPVTSITLSETTHSMPVDDSFTLTVKSVLPSNTPVKTVTWSTNDADENIIKVDQKTGKVTAVGAGQAAVIATADFGGVQAICVVTVTHKAEFINLAFNYDSNQAGTNKYTYTFRNTGNNYVDVTAILTPNGDYPPADPIRWVSKNPAIATVGSGQGLQTRITAVAPGKTTITAVPVDHNGKDRNIDPAEIEVTVSGVTILNDAGSPITSLTLMEGQHRQIEGQVLGSAFNGDPAVDWISSDPSVVSVSNKNSGTTTITARHEGTAIITATKGTYTAICNVTVTKDTAGVIEGISTKPGVAYEFSNLISRIQSACQTKTNAGLSYITNLAVSSTDQGILHDKHFSADDTGAGVGIQDRYYPGTAPQGQRPVSDLSFVPRTTFSGTAEISYTAWSTNNQSVNGVIRITVNGTGDVMYGGKAGSPVNFLAADFNRIHSNIRSVSFTPPLENTGTLYYKYTSSSQPGNRVTSSDVYYRTGTPSLDDVAFVPAAGYQGTVRIPYKGADTSGRSISGTVTINVTNDTGSGSSASDISYSVREDSWVNFRPADFSTACRLAMGESLSHVRFTQPSADQGTLFYNYQGFSHFDGTVSSTTDYNYNGTPTISGVAFVPTTTTPGRVDIPYTGYTTRGNTFTGTVHISLGSGTNSTPSEQTGLRYTVFTGRSVNFNAGDFNTLCVTKLGRNLASIQFNGLPGTSQGSLRFTRGNSSTPNNVTTGTRFLRSGSSTSNLIENIYFQAATGYTGTFTIPFTGTSESGATFSDVVTIVVTPPVSSEITYSGTTANPIALSSSRVASAAGNALNGSLSYITFNNLPDTTAGKLCLNYSGLGTGTPVTTGTRYYASGTSGIDQISFVPRGRCTGQVGVGYTAVSTSGQAVSGRIMFNITSTGNSAYFNDMYYHTWAAPSVDYLYRNNVVKGTSATTFSPNSHIKRCDFVLMLCRAFRLSGNNEYSFADVPLNAYYSQAAATAKRLGIISGGYFNPNGEVTREDGMLMIYNALNAAGWNIAPASTSVLNQFSDGGSVNDYARNAVSALVQLGAVNGSTSGRLNPHNPITRAEAAIIFHFVLTM